MDKTLFKIIFLIVSLCSISYSHAEYSYEQELKQGCAKIKHYRQSGQNFYQQKNYKKALEPFQNQASWSVFCSNQQDESGMKFSKKEIDIANNNVGLTYAKLGKPLWARAWFQIDAHSKISQFNLKQLPMPKKQTDLSGEYVNYAGYGTWNHITVKKLKQKYHIEFNGVYMGLRSLIYGPNLGFFETTMPLKHNKATTQECAIDLAFGFNAQVGNFVSVNQKQNLSDCGYFGHNVSANGLYQKVEAE
ncbi:MAG: hypothetical protein RR569_06000 [Acinetobacter sp.]